MDARRRAVTAKYRRYAQFVDDNPHLTMLECAAELGISIKTLRLARRTLGYGRRTMKSDTADLLRSIKPGTFKLLPASHQGQVSHIYNIAASRGMEVWTARRDDEILVARIT